MALGMLFNKYEEEHINIAFINRLTFQLDANEKNERVYGSEHCREEIALFNELV